MPSKQVFPKMSTIYLVYDGALCHAVSVEVLPGQPHSFSWGSSACRIHSQGDCNTNQCWEGSHRLQDQQGAEICFSSCSAGGNSSESPKGNLKPEGLLLLLLLSFFCFWFFWRNFFVIEWLFLFPSSFLSLSIHFFLHQRNRGESPNSLFSLWGQG